MVIKKIISVLCSLLFILLFSNCRNKQTSYDSAKKYVDSMNVVRERSIEIEDSIKAIKSKENSLIAWGDAKFGMSQKEVLNTKAFEGSKVYGNTISMKYENRQITNVKTSIESFEAEFKMGELYCIEIQSYPQTANYIDDLEKDIMEISSKFEERYGKPTYSMNKNIDIFDFNEGDEFLYKKWIIGSKTIYLQFGEVHSGSEYYYRISIDNSDFPTKKDLEEIEHKKKLLKEQAEKEKYQF